MSRYVIVRTDQGGGYVTPSGAIHSYTKDLIKARTFATRDKAQAYGTCGNERIVCVDDLLLQGGRG